MSEPNPEDILAAWKKVHEDNPDVPPEQLFDLIMKALQKVIDEAKIAESSDKK
jgi:hypothetical protein